MALDLTGSFSQGGSAQQSYNNAQSQAYAETDGSSAREWSAQQAQIARDWQERMMEKQMMYNSAEAAKEREWQQNNINTANQMANTVYTRAAENMKAAGINPILAYTAGLGGVGSGTTSGASAATASLPSGAMGQSFADQHSASTSYSHGEGSGSSWQESQSGLATGLQLMGEAISSALSNMNTGSTINYMLSGLGDGVKTTWNDIKGMLIQNLPDFAIKALGLEYDASSTKGEAPKRKKVITGSTRDFNWSLKNGVLESK